jgi:hypothetical protein
MRRCRDRGVTGTTTTEDGGWTMEMEVQHSYWGNSLRPFEFIYMHGYYYIHDVDQTQFSELDHRAGSIFRTVVAPCIIWFNGSGNFFVVGVKSASITIVPHWLVFLRRAKVQPSVFVLVVRHCR